jgi:hypothetical protein
VRTGTTAADKLTGELRRVAEQAEEPARSWLMAMASSGETAPDPADRDRVGCQAAADPARSAPGQAGQVA